MESDALINKYRPRNFGQVVGHAVVVKSLKAVLRDGTAHAFLFSGPSGTGKTTLARIVAEELGCTAFNINEVDAATKSGIDDTRALQDVLHLMPMGGGSRAVIVDECHALSAAAWKSLLKVVEEPPKHAYWLLCTTDPGKVPETVKTRCVSYQLRPVKTDLLFDLLVEVAEAEKFRVTDAVLRMCARNAGGSPRMALAYLAKVSDCSDERDAADLLEDVTDEVPEAVELAKLLASGASWGQAVTVLGRLKELNPESVRHTVRGYFTAMALSGKNERSAGKIMAVLDEFSRPFATADGMTPLVLAVGRLLLLR